MGGHQRGSRPDAQPAVPPRPDLRPTGLGSRRRNLDLPVTKSRSVPVPGTFDLRSDPWSAINRGRSSSSRCCSSVPGSARLAKPRPKDSSREWNTSTTIPAGPKRTARGAGAARRVPAAHKITFSRWRSTTTSRAGRGLIWHRSGDVAPLFDSPDHPGRRGSGAHLMGLIAPGPDPNLRTDGDLFPFRSGRLEANRPLAARPRWRQGAGTSVVLAIETYVASAGGGAGSFAGSSSGRLAARLEDRGLR